MLFSENGRLLVSGIFETKGIWDLPKINSTSGAIFLSAALNFLQYAIILPCLQKVKNATAFEEKGCFSFRLVCLLQAWQVGTHLRIFLFWETPQSPFFAFSKKHYLITVISSCAVPVLPERNIKRKKEKRKSNYSN